MKSRMYAVVDENGELIGASFAFPDASGIPIARPAPVKPGHTFYELDVPHELAANPTAAVAQAAIKKHLMGKKKAK